MSFPVPPTSVLARKRLAVATRRAPDARGTIRKVKSVLPAKQALVRHNRVELFQQDLNLPPSLFDGSSGKKTARWEAGQCHNIKAVTLKIEFETTGANMTVNPVWFFFDRICFRVEGGSRFIHECWPQSQEMLAYVNNPHFDVLGSYATGTNPSGLGYVSRRAGTHTYYYRLENTVFHDLYAENPNLGDILVDFYPRSPFSDELIPSGTSCTHIATTLMVECDKVGAVDENVHRSLHQTAIISRVMCLPQRLEFNGQSLGGGTAKTIRYDLDSLTGKYAFLTCYLHANGGQGTDLVNYRAWSYPGTAYELKTVGNVSLSGGAPIPSLYTYSFEWAKHFPMATRLMKDQQFLFIPLCHDCHAAVVHGDRSGGYLSLDGSRHHLDITFGGAQSLDTDYQLVIFAWKFQMLHIRGKTITLEDC